MLEMVPTNATRQGNEWIGVECQQGKLTRNTPADDETQGDPPTDGDANLAFIRVHAKVVPDDILRRNLDRLVLA